MDAATENRLRSEQMESLGRMLAGFSHDMRNHLAVIRESNGLLEDLLTMEMPDEHSRLPEQMKKAIALIEERVSKSADLCRHLSGLAHRSDLFLSSFDLNELISELTVFLDRPARLRRVHLRPQPGSEIQPLYNDSALLQHVVYRLTAFFLEQAEEGGTLLIGTGQEEELRVVNFLLVSGAQVSLAAFPETMSAAVGKLGGELEVQDLSAEGGPDASGLRLLIPSLSQQCGMP